MSFDDERRRMVETQIALRGVRQPAVLEAMGKVPREKFVPEVYVHLMARIGAPVDRPWASVQVILSDGLEVGDIAPAIREVVGREIACPDDQMTWWARPTSTKAATACSRCAGSCPALICTRMRAAPCGTTG